MRRMPKYISLFKYTDQGIRDVRQSAARVRRDSVQYPSGSQAPVRGWIHGFSQGLMSIARPFACGEAFAGAFASEGLRQLNAVVLSARPLFESQPP